MKRLIQLFAIVMMFSVSYIASAQTLVSTDPMPRNAVLEEFTGIYCGYCPQGDAIAQDIMDNNPGRAFAINIHTGGYAQPQAGSGHPDFQNEWGAAIASISGLTGYPAGQVNRQVFSGSAMAMGRGSWTSAAAQVIADTEGSPLNIGAATRWNAETRTVEIDIEVYFTADVTEGAKLNIAFLQSGVIAYQGGGSANYEHNHILRDLLTGQWGEELTETTEGSLFTKTYTYSVDGKSWADLSGSADPYGAQFDIEKCNFVAFITKGTDRFIYTGIEFPAITPNLVIDAAGSTFDAIASGSDFEKTVTINNTTDVDFTATATIETSDRTPADWAALISGDTELTITAGSSVDVTFALTPGATAGIGDATLMISETNVENPISYKTMITAVSKEATYLEISDDDDLASSIQSQLAASGRTNFVTLDYESYAKVKDAMDPIEYLIWNSGKKGGFSIDEANMVDDLLKAGVKVFFQGSVAIPFLTFEDENHKLLTTLGVNWTGDNNIDNQTFDLAGVYNDPVVDGWEAKNLSYTDNGYLMQKLDITNNETTSSMIEMQQNDYTISVRVESTWGRTIYLGFNTEIITDDAIRNDLIERCLNWIEGETDVEETTVSGPMSVNVTPNPATEASTVSYTLNSTNAQNVRLSIVNSLGQEVSLLLDETVNPGTHTMNLKSNTLSSGTYYMVMKSGTELVSTPVVIVK